MAQRRRLWQALCVLLIVFGVIVPSLLLLVTMNTDTDASEAEQSLLRSVVSTHERKPLDYVPDSKEVNELKMQIRELEHIRASVRDELREFEQQRTKLSKDVESHKESLGKVKNDLATAKTELQDTRGKLSKATRDLYDKVEPVAAPVVNAAPIIILPSENKMASLTDLKNAPPQGTLKDSDFALCSFPLCFQYTRCPLTRPFSVFLYNHANPHLFPLRDDTLVTEYVSSLKDANSFTSDPSTACVYVAIVESSDDGANGLRLQERVHSLEYWREEGENHVLIELSSSLHGDSVLEGVQTGRAIVARSALSPSKPLRPHYDILVPPLHTTPLSWRDTPTILPAFRDNLLYFQGDYRQPLHPTGSTSLAPSDLKSLQQAMDGRESVKIELQCTGSDSSMLGNVREGEWALCGGQSSRLSLCSQSTFSLVPSPDWVRNGVGTATYTRLIESLVCGSIPVVVGIKTLPFDDVIDWQQAAVILPPGRFPDIHYILRSIDRDTILDMRRQGHNLWQMYFSSPRAVVQSVMAIVRCHALHPPPIAPDFSGVSLHSQGGSHRRILSPTLTQNFTVYSTRLWNNPPGPFFTYPTTPFKPVPISGHQFVNLDEHALARLPLHIVDGGGITGPNFEDLLLGNSPEEQFTVVMLTYQRNMVLLQALTRLKDVSFLNKVVIVWNNEENPPADLQWPNIGVPIEVVRGKGNSLNNRFLPFKEIETEAVLSIDDDVNLRPDEIEFAFRVWREARDRIVGFPGRFHAYDLKHNSWMYNSNYTCELSMVLTGAAFFHKFYSYLYTYWQPVEVREMVDQYMNCEDIAMNFLVSHVTRKPPLKVTSRWTFRCPGCPEALSTDDSHFHERHVCMKALTSLYGYMPLLYTQFRVDSVLFKTRLPTNLEKCYQFI